MLVILADRFSVFFFVSLAISGAQRYLSVQFGVRAKSIVSKTIYFGLP